MSTNTLGVLLAGGQSLRMGHGDKCLILHQGQTLLQHCLGRAQPQVDELVISANGDADRFRAFQLPVIQDIWPDHTGPLAGIISVMSWAQKARKDYAWLATFATDTPHFPADLVQRLQTHAEVHSLSVVLAADARDKHYTFALWSTSLLPELVERYHQGERALHRVMQDLGAGIEIFPEAAKAFFNVNTPQDLETLKNQRT